MKASFAENSAQRQRLTEENEKLRKQLKRISGGNDVDKMESLDELKQSKAGLEAKLREVEVRLDGKSVQAERDDKEMESLIERNKALSLSSCTYFAELQEQVRQGQDLLKERDELRQRVAESDISTETLQSSNQNLKAFNTKLQDKLTKVETDTAGTIAKLRTERDEAVSEAARCRSEREDIAKKLKLTAADLEVKEDHKTDEIRSLRDQVASLQNAVQLAEKKSARLAEEMAEEHERRHGIEADMASLEEAMRENTDRYEAELASCRAKMASLTEARNASENEVVSLRAQMQKLRPLELGEDDADGAAGSFSLTEVIKMAEDLQIAKEKLANLQKLYQDAVSKTSKDAAIVQQEKTRANQLAAEVLDLRFNLSKATKDRDALLVWKQENRLAVNQAKDAIECNELLSTQLQYLIQSNAQCDAEQGAAQPHLSVEFDSVKEMQQQNIKLNQQLLAKERARDEALAVLRESLEAEFQKQVSQMSEGLQAVSKERDSLETALHDSTERCRRLSETLAACGTRKLSEADSAPETKGAQDPAAFGDRDGIMAPQLTDNDEKTQLADELQASREDLTRLNYQLLCCQRDRETAEAAHSHTKAMLRSSEDMLRQLETEKSHYRDQAEVSEKSADDMLRKLIDAQGKVHSYQVQIASLEVQLDLCKQDIERLASSNVAMTSGQNKLSDVLLQVDSISSFVQKQHQSAESAMRLERDAVRQSLAEKENELQGINNALRTGRAKHEQDVTDLNAQLATCKEQLAATSKMLEEEKEAHKLQIIHSKKLGADLERAESERRILKQTDTVEDANFLATDSEKAKELQRQVDERDIQIRVMKESSASLNAAMRKLETFAREAKSKIAGSQTEIAAERSRADAAEKREAEKKASWDQQTQQLTEREANVKQMESQQKATMQGLQQRVAMLQKELDDGEGARKEALERRQQAEEEAEKIKERYESALIEKGELTKTLQEMKVAAALGTQAAPAGTLESRTPALSSEREAHLREDIEQLQGELDRAHNVLARVEAAKEVRDSDINALLDVTRVCNSELTRRLRSSDMEKNVLSAQVDQLRRQALLSSKQTSQTDTIAKYERRIQNLKDDVQERTNREDTLRKELEQAVNEKEEMRAATAALGRLKQMEKEKTELENRVRQLTPRANEATKLRESLNAKNQAYLQMKENSESLAKRNTFLQNKNESLSGVQKDKEEIQRRFNQAVTEARLEKTRRETLEQENGKIKLSMEEKEKEIATAQRKQKELATLLELQRTSSAEQQQQQQAQTQAQAQPTAPSTSPSLDAATPVMTPPTVATLTPPPTTFASFTPGSLKRTAEPLPTSSNAMRCTEPVAAATEDTPFTATFAPQSSGAFATDWPAGSGASSGDPFIPTAPASQRTGGSGSPLPAGRAEKDNPFLAKGW
eukprot:TRINITY_DN1496_c6_g1_i1.p1 TRINITY_DN1496_c6_g1~~TRINITY_DN1496_c6_g1_i1.p1  ORF type:complete len:1453 (+),score=765.51 TRINITY_DN1496_c6_g1_i1:142-4359(+)